LTVPWSFDASLAVHALMVGLIQSFFAYRVYTVSGNLWLAVPGWFCAFGRTIVTWAIAALFHMEKLGPFKEAHGWIVFLTLALSVAVCTCQVIGIGRLTEFRREICGSRRPCASTSGRVTKLTRREYRSRFRELMQV
jgi:hypothetical protein